MRRFSTMRPVLSLGLALFVALPCGALGQAQAIRMLGSGRVHPDTGRLTAAFYVNVAGRSGRVAYTDRNARLVFRSSTIRVTRVFENSYGRTGFIDGYGSARGVRVRFNVDLVDANSGPRADSFVLRLYRPGPRWLYHDGGRVVSGNITLSR
jgi:hypothetical protein